jgi:hypothetical protein
MHNPQSQESPGGDRGQLLYPTVSGKRLDDCAAYFRGGA